AHIERASYWPDPGADTADGVPTGGAVPDVRSLFSALDGGAVGETRVVCQTGQPIPYRAGEAVLNRRPDLPVSRERVDRLRKKLRRLRRKLDSKTIEASKKKQRKVKRRVKRMKRKRNRAKAAYQDALDGELEARSKAKSDFDRALGEELAARQAYRQALAADPSMNRLGAALAEAVTAGYLLRPSEPRVKISGAEAEALYDFNAQLLGQCAYDEIQPAVNDSGNNDRVVVMPGVYTEPTARAVPTDPPAAENPCEDLKEVNDRGQTGANSYAYVATCPNDQHLIAVIGREPRHDQVPQPPQGDRHDIPDEGPCIRCNLQLEGSGVGPDDVVVDGGDPSKGNGADPDPAKHVGIRADRADGFVLSNMSIRHVSEHALYVHETDGYVNQRFKTFHAHEYGTLQFTSDHGVIRDCEAYGSGDAGLYPGSAPDTGEQVEASDSARFNTEITRCDMHHNTAGYSGTAANAVWLHHNDFYDNALGFTTDVFTAAGHPGFPQDSDLLENNEFYSNNFNPYVDQPDEDEVVPTIPVPVGTGMWIAGGNNNNVRNNHFWDNWRRGAMLFAVPDVLVCGPTTGTAGEQVFGCDPLKFSTSHRNRFQGNVMGRSPAGTVDATWPEGANEVARNGVDFWWDQFPLNTKNCWVNNVGPDGTRGSLNTVPPINPIGPGLSLPLLFLPEDCATSIGLSGALQEVELVSCLAQFEEGLPTPCSWFTTPAKP
ncbi:MAG: hypothetical protein ACRDKH_06685, partial [Solirubrobacterales bacterium]